MKQMSIIIGLFFLGYFIPVASYGQSKPDEMEEVKRIMNELKNSNGNAYTYSIILHYPDSRNINMQGEVYINVRDKVLYNSSNEQTMIYAGHWFYKADHKRKTIVIEDLNANANLETKAGIESDVFRDGALTNFIDSVLMKYASLTYFKSGKDTIKAAFTFPEGMTTKKINFTYSKKRKAFFDYHMTMFQPVGRKGNKIEGVTQTFDCRNFRKATDTKKYGIDNFFSVSNSRIVLKKHKEYKILPNS